MREEPLRPADVQMYHGVRSEPDVEFPDAPYHEERSPISTDVPDAIPVVIVDTFEAGRLVDWAVERVPVDATQAVRVTGARRNRARLLVANAGPNTVYVLRTALQMPAFGYPLVMGATLELFHNEEVFAITAATETASLGVISEYDIEGKP